MLVLAKAVSMNTTVDMAVPRAKEWKGSEPWHGCNDNAAELKSITVLF